MGIDLHGLRFLRYLHRHGDFGNTVTLGRQAIMLDQTKLASELDTGAAGMAGAYADDLFKTYFGSTRVDSIDNSDFENATLICDMNRLIDEKYEKQYDTVIDFGCLEHIYRATTALENCSRLCRTGGQIVHYLPANNACGHGFWQFSPELFFSLYSTENGYSNTEVFLADLTDLKHWYSVSKPANGKRVNVTTRNETYILVRTRLDTAGFHHENVQQSDYVHQWNSTEGGVRPKRSFSDRMMQSSQKRLRQLVRAGANDLKHNIYLRKCAISELI